MKKKHYPFEGLSKHFLCLPNVSPYCKNRPGALGNGSCIHKEDAVEKCQKVVPLIEHTGVQHLCPLI